ncbi:hypothetical protein [uncultured Flavobacterium sp.]|uniref:hypothetical protein n=1 Tax=uncultured Flavobacterium sp. TaxID=165435 RepID=UPI0030EE4FCE|tara:strand:+ start:36994 stop:37443 length:450 start_codon:yes stop_codon:yes gene_type:complete
MANFNQQLEKANAIKPELVSKALFDFIKSIEKELIDLNKKQLNEDSKDIYGEVIGFYSYATEVISKGSKKRGEPFDAKDTGGFLNNFYMTVLNETFYFGSTDPKTDDILDSPNWLSSDLFGLSEENLKEVIETKFKPFVIEYYRKSLGV